MLAPLRSLGKATAAALAGVATGLSWQPYGWWPLLFVGIPALTLLVRTTTTRWRAFGLGYLYGLTMLAVAVSWVQVLGDWVAVALVLFESLFFALLGLSLNLVSRLRLWPLAAALAWVLAEFAYARVPFGGFGWTRIAYAAVDTPLAGFLPFLGVVGVSFLVALIGQLVAWYAVRLSTGGAHLTGRVLAVAGLSAAIVVGGAALRTDAVVGASTPAQDEPEALRVGIVQGNVPGRGIEALGRARSVTNNHLSETIDLVTRARLDLVDDPDFILWPENSTDIDPLRDAVTGQVVASAVEIAGVPILVGSVTAGPGPDERQTTALWWDPDRGVLARYHKRNLVPFGEWIPFRDTLLPVLPILKQTGAQSVPGTEPGVLTVEIHGQLVSVGDVICFELAYDQTVYDTVRNGAQILTVQSNNATYGGTGQIEQQFAITRARAMELRREIAVATTNSVSGFIERDGTVTKRTAEFTSDSFVRTMPLRTGLTPAVLIAPWLDRLLSLSAVICIAVAIGRRRSSGSRMTPLAATNAERVPTRNSESVMST